MSDQATSQRRDESFRDCSIPFCELGRYGTGGGGFCGHVHRFTSARPCGARGAIAHMTHMSESVLIRCGIGSTPRRSRR